jgi:hypothetical protein
MTVKRSDVRSQYQEKITSTDQSRLETGYNEYTVPL